MTKINELQHLSFFRGKKNYTYDRFGFFLNYDKTFLNFLYAKCLLWNCSAVQNDFTE